MNSGSFAERDPQSKASYASFPPCSQLTRNDYSQQLLDSLYEHPPTHTHTHHITTVPYWYGTGWWSLIGCFVGHFLQKNPINSGTFAERDPQLEAFYASFPPCMELDIVYCTLSNETEKCADCWELTENWLQHTATLRNSLQPTATQSNETEECANCWELTATHCNSLQLTATHSNTE